MKVEELFKRRWVLFYWWGWHRQRQLERKLVSVGLFQEIRPNLSSNTNNKTSDRSESTTDCRNLCRISMLGCCKMQGTPNLSRIIGIGKILISLCQPFQRWRNGFNIRSVTNRRKCRLRRKLNALPNRTIKPFRPHTPGQEILPMMNDCRLLMLFSILCKSNRQLFAVVCGLWLSTTHAEIGKGTAGCWPRKSKLAEKNQYSEKIDRLQTDGSIKARLRKAILP